MKNRITIFIILGLIFFIHTNSIACPFMITNDSGSPIIITDNDKQAVYIKPQETKTIDPTIQGWIAQYFFTEKLNFYIEYKPGEFYFKYQLLEYYCVPDWKEKNQFTLSDIKKFIDNPTKRLKVNQFEKPEKHDHKHSH